MTIYLLVVAFCMLWASAWVLSQLHYEEETRRAIVVLVTVSAFAWFFVLIYSITRAAHLEAIAAGVGGG